MIEIPLTRGKTAVVDDEDSYVLAGRKWQASREGKETSISWYAIQGKRPRIRMHRLVMEHKLNRPLLSGEQIDHINHNGLDNRRSNLRIATANENQQNARLMNTPKSSKYKGVTWNKHAKQWKAGIRVDGRRCYLGHFRSEEDAAKAYNLAALKYFGKFAEINEGIIIDPRTDSWIEKLPGHIGRCDRCKTFAKFVKEEVVEGKPARIYFCEKCKTETRKEA